MTRITPRKIKEFQAYFEKKTGIVLSPRDAEGILRHSIAIEKATLIFYSKSLTEVEGKLAALVKFVCGIVEEVRTYFRDSNDDFYIPDFSSDEEIREAA